MVRLLLALLFVLTIVSCTTEYSDSSNELFTYNSSPGEVIQKGKVLFSTNCKVCHSLDANHPTSMGPILDSVKTHWPDRAVLTRYIKNAPDMIHINERSQKIYNVWKKKSQMPTFTGFDPDEINSIVSFLYNSTI